MIDLLRIANETALPELYEQCMERLRDHSRMIIFNYPGHLRSVHSTDAAWDTSGVTIRQLNEHHFPAGVRLDANCYAIYSGEQGDAWRLRYLGHAEPRRIKSHLADRLAPLEKRPSALFRRSREIIRAGGELGVRLLKIEPETLRFFVCEKALTDLRNDGLLDWNRVGI